MSKKFNEKQTCKFVTLYREHKCLWDIKSENYKNKAMRELALKNICKEMQIEGFGVEDAKNKIKSIRSTYYLELDKIKKSITSVTNDKVYQSKIKWFTELDSFIRKVMVKKKTHDNDSIQSQSENNVAATPALCFEIQSSVSKAKKSKVSELASSMRLLQDDSRNKVEEEEDEFDIFGKHIVKQLRKLSTEQGIIAQKEIQGVITKYRLNDLQSQAPTPTWASTAPVAYASTSNIQTAPSSTYILLAQSSPSSIIKEEEREKIH